MYVNDSPVFIDIQSCILMVFLEHHIYNHEYILEMHTQLQIMLNKCIGEPEEDEKKALFLLTSLMSKRDNLVHASIYEEFQVSF